MILFAEREYRFLGLERRVTQYVLFAVAVVLFLFMSLAHQQGWFEKAVPPYFTADTAGGLSRGMAVKFKGFKIGNIQDIAIGDDLKVRVTLSIQDKYIKFLNRTARPRLTKEGVIGEASWRSSLAIWPASRSWMAPSWGIMSVPTVSSRLPT